jgi:hypothetical protein
MAFKTLIESMYANEYTDENTRSMIVREYQQRHSPIMAPQTHPEFYNPLDPPPGWRYDPYYEIWIKLKT